MECKYFNSITHDFQMLSDELDTELQELFGNRQYTYKQYNLLEGVYTDVAEPLFR
jgi:hypothetical protein